MSGKLKVLIVMGASGCGKTTVASLLAQRLSWQFADADDYHPDSNKEKMKVGIALNDEDRMPWLLTLKKEIDSWIENDKPTVLACSALKESYRFKLAGENEKIKFIYLKADRELLEARHKIRVHEYMNPRLIMSQLESLEEPKKALTVDAAQNIETLVAEILKKLTISE